MKGFWFCVMAGAGKTTATQHLASLQRDAFIIDGDLVRRHISTDLGYTVADRETQLSRVLGISIIAMNNQIVPIASTVFMNKQTLAAATKVGKKVIKIQRDQAGLSQARILYDGSHANVVGQTLTQPVLPTAKIENTNKKDFLEAISRLLSK